MRWLQWRRPAPAPSALACRLEDSTEPLGGLGLHSTDLAALIAAETDPRVLRAAMARADRVGDDRWRIATRDRLQALDPDPAVLVDLIELCCNTRQDQRAAALLPLLERLQPLDGVVAPLRVRVAAACGDWDRAGAELTRVAPAVAHPMAHHVAAVRLMQGGADAALAQVRDLLAARPSFDMAAVTAVKAALVLDGQAAAREEQAAHRIALPPGSAAAVEAEALILLHAGRQREAGEVIAAALRNHPRAAPLLWLAIGLVFVEVSNDRIDKALQSAALGPDRAADLTIARIFALTARAEFDSAAEAMEQLRRLSDWSWHTAQVHLASQRDDVEATLDALDAARDAGVWHAGPAMNAAVLLATRAPQHPRAQAAFDAHAGHARWEAANAGYWAQRLRVQTVRGEEAAARSLCGGLPPGLRVSAEIAPLDAFLHRDPQAPDAPRAFWRQHVATSAPPAICADTAPPVPIALTWRGGSTDVLLFAVVQNGMEFLPWLVAYYRTLGVDHLFIVDNASTDGSADWLRRRAEEQGDVSLFEQPGSFRQAAHGVAWTNHLMQRFGVGHWCFHVDMDEAFVFPGMDTGRSLSDLLAWLDATGAESVPAFMLDIYPERLDLPAGDDPFAASTLIDDDYVSIPNEVPPYTLVLGGLRARMARQTLLMTKAPLVRMRRDLFYLSNNHSHTGARVSDLSAVLLHYKFVGDLRARVDEQVARGEHFMGGRFYRSLQGPLRDKPILRDRHSVTYAGPEQLVSMGYMNAPQAWRDWHRGAFVAPQGPERHTNPDDNPLGQ